MTRSSVPDAGDDENEFDAFFRAEHDGQVRRAYLLLRSNEAANDVVHDALIGVYERWADLREPGAYLNRAVMNGCRDVLRRRESRRSIVDRLRPVDNDGAPSGGESVAMDRALAGLPFNQRAAVILRFYGGWTADEIADALDCSPNSIGPWISRALAVLRKELS